MFSKLKVPSEWLAEANREMDKWLVQHVVECEGVDEEAAREIVGRRLTEKIEQICTSRKN